MMLAQRRHGDVEDVEPVVKIGAQMPLGHSLRDRGWWPPARARQYPARCARPTGGACALPARAAAWLACHGHLAHFVQQQRAARGQLEAAESPFHRAGEGALLVAEDLALDQRFGNRRAVDRDEWPRLARAQIVQRARHQFLAGAALAGDQHREHSRAQSVRSARRSPASRGELPTNDPRTPVSRNLRRATSNSISVSRCRVALARMVRRRVASTGFCRKSYAPSFMASTASSNRSHCRQHHHRHIRVQARTFLGQFGQQADAVQPRHLQVGDHNGRVPGQCLLPSLDAVPRGLGAVSPAGDQLRQAHQCVGLIFDDQNLHSLCITATRIPRLPFCRAIPPNRLACPLWPAVR